MSNNIFPILGNFYCNNPKCKSYNKKDLRDMEFRFVLEVKHCKNCKQKLEKEYNKDSK